MAAGKIIPDKAQYSVPFAQDDYYICIKTRNFAGLRDLNG